MTKQAYGRDLATIGGRVWWAITQYKGISQAEAVRRLEIHPSQLSRWVNDPDRPPSEESMGRIAELTGVPQSWLHYGGELPEAGISAPEPEMEPRPPTGVDLLLDGPRRLYKEFMGELFAAGCDHEAMERASDMLLAPIAAGAGLSETLQLMALRLMMVVVRADLGLPEPGSSSGMEPGGGALTSQSSPEAGAERMLQDLRDAGQLPGEGEHPGEGEPQRTPA